MHTPTIDLNKELVPLGIYSILCEGGVAAHTSMIRRFFDDVDAFGGAEGAYAKAEGGFATPRPSERR